MMCVYKIILRPLTPCIYVYMYACMYVTLANSLPYTHLITLYNAHTYQLSTIDTITNSLQYTYLPTLYNTHTYLVSPSSQQVCSRQK